MLFGDVDRGRRRCWLQPECGSGQGGASHGRRASLHGRRSEGARQGHVPEPMLERDMFAGIFLLFFPLFVPLLACLLAFPFAAGVLAGLVSAFLVRAGLLVRVDSRHFSLRSVGQSVGWLSRLLALLCSSCIGGVAACFFCVPASLHVGLLVCRCFFLCVHARLL